MEEKFVTFCFSQIAYQNKDDFETFLESLEFIFDNAGEKDSLTMTVLSNFMAKSESCYTNDSKNFEGLEIDSLNSSFGFHQAINKTTIFWTINLPILI